jgi:hypothetical protein
MKPIKLLFDKAGNTLNVWFDDPQAEYIAEEPIASIVSAPEPRPGASWNHPPLTLGTGSDIAKFEGRFARHELG